MGEENGGGSRASSSRRGRQAMSVGMGRRAFLQKGSLSVVGAGLATVLTAVGVATVYLRRGLLPGGPGGEVQLVRRLPGLHGRLGGAADAALAWLGRSLTLIAPCIIAALGLVLVVWGLRSAGAL